MADTCFINRDGKVIGKASPDTVKKHIASGKILPTDQIGKSSNGPWRAIADISSLAKLIPSDDESIEDLDGNDDELLQPHLRPRKNTGPGTTEQLTDEGAEKAVLSRNLIALICVAGFMVLSVVGGGGMFLAKSVVKAPVPAAFSLEDTVEAFAWVGTLPETIALNEAFQGGNPIREEAARAALQRRLEQVIEGKVLTWQLQLTELTIDGSKFKWFGNIGTTLSPILISTQLDALGDTVSNYNEIFGGAKVGDVFTFEVIVQRVQVSDGYEAWRNSEVRHDRTFWDRVPAYNYVNHPDVWLWLELNDPRVLDGPEHVKHLL